MAEWIASPGGAVLVGFVFFVGTIIGEQPILLAVWKGVRFWQRLWERATRGRLDSQQARQELREVREDVQRLEEQLQEITETLRWLK